MKSDTTYLFFDKYANNHSFNNVITQPLTLNLIKITLHNYIITENLQAIMLFNNLYSNFWKITEDLDLTLYHPLLLKTVFRDIPITIFLLGINHKKFEEYNNDFKLVPNNNFLALTIYYHLKYINNIKQKNNAEINNIEIINKIKNDDIVYNIDNTKFSKFNLNLFNYQKQNIMWMYNRELNPIKLKCNFDNVVYINNTFIDASQQVIYPLSHSTYEITGGGLIDEIGLGKTAQIVALAYININITNSNNFLFSNATLIICPNTICNQWRDEINKIIPSNVIIFTSKMQYKKYSYEDIYKANFVIMSYNFLENKALLNELYDEDDKLINNTAVGKTQKNVNILYIKWHRLVIDEFHDLYKYKSNSKTLQIIKLLQSTYRWFVTGTPFENNKSLITILQYIINNKYMPTDILKYDNILRFITNDCFRRNTKESISNEYKFTQIKENVIWLKFTATERAIYNSFLANPDNNKDDIFLRKLCCHPKLAEEMKLSFNTCKTMLEIERGMLTYNEKQLNSAKDEIDDINNLLQKAINFKNELNSNNSDDETDVNARIENLTNKLKLAQNKYDGKNKTLIFYKNVIEKLHNKTLDTCGICLDTIADDNIGVTICGHIFCYNCINMSFSTNKKCPYCTNMLTSKDISLISYNNSNNDDLINKVGTKIGNLITYLQKINHNVVIFSQWDILLKKISKILTQYNLPNLFCCGTANQCDKIIQKFNNNDIRIIMLSSDNYASGTNLTKASEVILLEPIYGSKEYKQNIEKQAIGRIYRIGQTQPITVTRFIIKDTIEEESL